MSEYPIYVVDAFIRDAPFSGNPAGVCILETWASVVWMQAVAAEMKHSETAFLVKEGPGFRIRYFTPTQEIALCGHASLAAAMVLRDTEIPDTPISLYAGDQTLTVTDEGESMTLDFPAMPCRSEDEIEPVQRQELQIKPQQHFYYETDCVYMLTSEEAVRDYVPEIPRMMTLPYRMHIFTAASSSLDIDFVSRVFAPTVGIDEDLATGIAHCILGPLWAQKLNKTTLTSEQVSSRGGRFGISVSGDRVYLSGKASIVLKGVIIA